jgi:2-methylfumaryl-CoA hydratase
MGDAQGKVTEPRYGRRLDDFKVGDVYHHLWEVTLDEGMMAWFAASFLDPNPLYSSRRFARAMGFRDRVVHPLLLMNLALSSSVHDVSEQAIAHLAYIDLRFPNAAYAGDTLSVKSEVLGGHTSASKPDRGVVHVRTTAVNQDGVPVVTFERKALLPTGRLDHRAHPDGGQQEAPLKNPGGGEPVVGERAERALPAELAGPIPMPEWAGRPRGLFDDFEEGEIILHGNGRTVGESEHMQLTWLTRNTHPLHVDEVYAKEQSFTGTRVVCGPLVFAWVAALASRDTTANAIWDFGYDKGSHAAPVLAGDTLFAASRVLEKREFSEQAGLVTFHLVGLKNTKPAAGERAGFDLFGGKVEERVFEIEHRVLLPKIQALSGGKENS